MAPAGPPHRERALLVAVLVLALFLRLPGYTESVWIDELYTSNLFCGEPVILLKTLYSDIHPPAYFILIHFWNSVFGDAEVWLRLPPLLCGLASIALLRSLGNLFAGPPVGLVAAFLLATSPVHIWYSQEARPYSFSVFALLATTLIVYRLLERRRSLLWVPLYFLAISAVVFTHYYMAAFLVVFAALAWWRGGPGRNRILWVNAVVLVLLGAYMAAKAYFSEVPTSKGYLGGFGPTAAWRLGFEWFLTGNSLTPIDGRTAVGDGLLLILQVLAVAACGRGCWRLFRRRPESPAVAGGDAVGLLLVLPAALFALNLLGLDHTFIERSALPSLPFFFVVLAAGVVGAASPRAERIGLVVMAAGVVTVLTAFFTRGDTWTVYKPNPDWRAAAAYLAEQLERPDHRLLLYSDYESPTPLTYYDARMQEAKNFVSNARKIDQLRKSTARVFGSDGFPGAWLRRSIETRLARFAELTAQAQAGTRVDILKLASHDPLAAGSQADARPDRTFWLLVHRDPSPRARALLAHRGLRVGAERAFRQLRLYELQRLR